MQRLKDLAVSDSGFVFDPMSGATFNANASALTILDALKRELDRGAIVDAVRARFDVLGADVSRDIDDLVATLRMHGLVPVDFEVAS